MKWMKLMLFFAVALLSCSVASAQAPDPVPDPGPGTSNTLCDQCCSLEDQIDSANQWLDLLYHELSQLDALLESVQAQRAAALLFEWPTQAERDAHIAALDAMIASIQAMISAKQTVIAAQEALIHDLWEQWLDLGCDEADC